MSSRENTLAQHFATLRRVVCVLAVTACSDIGSSSRPEAAALVAASAVLITAVAGDALVDLPAVVAVDARGNVVPGINVTFTSSDHTIIPVVVRSAVDGVARVVSWSAPRAAGASTITATATGLTPVRFELTTSAGPLASIRKLSGDQQIGYTNEPLPVDPSVKVADAFGNPVAGIHVVFAIDSGDGSLNTPATESRPDGVASAAAWTLKSIGRHVLSATVAGLTPQVFTAVAVEPPTRCGGERQLPVATTLHGQLTATDCTGADGRFYQLLGIPPLGAEFTFSLTSSDFDTTLEIVDEYGTSIATNDNSSAASTNSVIRGLFASRPMTAIVSTAKAGAGGLFAIGYFYGPIADSCDPVFTVRGISIERLIEIRQCPGITTPQDNFRIFLRAGELVSVSVYDLTYSAWKATMYDSAGREVSASGYSGNYTETLTLIPPTDGYYSLNIECGDSNGRYLLTIR